MNKKLLRYAFSVLEKEILLKLSGFLKSDFLPRPYRVTFLMAGSKCNAKCITCDIWKKTDDSEELSIPEWKRIVYDLSRWIGPCYIMFSGGEPFIKKDFFDLLELASRLNVYIDISTNGAVFNREVADRVMDIGVDFLQFSLNSIEPRIHNQYKGIENLHQNIVGTIKYIKGKNQKIKVGVCSLITKDNYKTLGDFALWAHDFLNVDSINFQPIRDNFGRSPHLNSDLTSNPYWKIEDFDEFDRQIDALISLKIKGLPINVPFADLKKFKVYFRDPNKILCEKNCDIGFKNLVIFPTGDVKLCDMSETIGNVKKSPIKAIWLSKEAQKQRLKMIECNKTCLLACLRNFSFLDKVLNFSMKSGINLFKKEKANKFICSVIKSSA